MTWAYPAIMALAILTGVAVARLTGRRLPLAAPERVAIALGAFCGGMIGAKLPFALADPAGLLTGRVWLENGKTIVFGLVGGYFGVEIAKWAMRVRIRTGDTLAVPVACAVGVGRWSCFVGGCCYGLPTSVPWGVDFHVEGDPPGVFRHPTQLYESAFHFACAVVLVLLGRAGLFRGQLVKVYLLAYLAYRFLTEYLRPEPRQPWLGGLTTYQATCLALVPVFAFLWWRDARAMAAETEATARP